MSSHANKFGHFSFIKAGIDRFHLRIPNRKKSFLIIINVQAPAMYPAYSHKAEHQSLAILIPWHHQLTG